jgi:hypothetical protein
MVEATINADANGDKPSALPSDGASITTDKHEGGNPQPERIGGFEVYSPSDLRFDDSSGRSGGKRGRPRGSKNRAADAQKTSQSNLIESVESLLLSTHFMLAKLCDVPELELDETEAKRLSEAFKKVAEFYPVGLSPKRLAWTEFCIAAGTVYGPRVVTIYKKKPKPAPVRVMPQQPQQAQTGSPGSPGPRPNNAAAANGPRVPSEMWGQDGNEVATDQA